METVSWERKLIAKNVCMKEVFRNNCKESKDCNKQILKRYFETFLLVKKASRGQDKAVLSADGGLNTVAWTCSVLSF